MKKTTEKQLSMQTKTENKPDTRFKEQTDKPIATNVAKSEEVQAIIDRMPIGWVKCVSLLFGFLMCLLIVLSCIIQYPDTVDGQITITANSAPVRLVAQSSGRISLLKGNKCQLKNGEVIAYLESKANYIHVLQLDSLLKNYHPEESEYLSLPGDLILGEVSPVFNSFYLSFSKYQNLLKSEVYAMMLLNLECMIKTDEAIIENHYKDLKLKEVIVANSTEQLEKDSVLLTLNAISEQEYQNKYNSWLSILESKLNLKSTILTTQSQINKNRLEIQRVRQEENESKEKAYVEVIARLNELTNAINAWKKQYLYVAPIDGDLEYLSFWKNNRFIEGGQELFSVMPERNSVYGEVLVPAYGVGKVKKGQNVNIKVDNFPYDEYGMLKGTVKTVSRISNTLKTKEGNAEVYLATIAFTNGMITNFGLELPLDFDTKGSAEIITKPKRLIERLFDNLRSKTEK